MNKIAQDTNQTYAFSGSENNLDTTLGLAEPDFVRPSNESVINHSLVCDQIADISKVPEFENLAKQAFLPFETKPKNSLLIEKILPKLHNLYGLSSVFSFIAAPLGFIPGAKKASDILQRVGYCLDTGAHQLRGLFTKGERVNLGMMVPTATAFLGTVAFNNKSFWGQFTRNIGNLCHLGILKDMLDFAQEFPDTLPDGTKEHIDKLQDKYGKKSSGLVQDFINDWKVALELSIEVIKNPNILKGIKNSLMNKKNQNIPHMQALSAIFLGTIGATSLVSKVLGMEKLSWKLNKSLAIFPTITNLIRAKSYSSMQDADLKLAGKYCEISSWGTLASALINFKFEDVAMAARSFFMGVNTMSFRKEAIKIFRAAAVEMMNKIQAKPEPELATV